GGADKDTGGLNKGNQQDTGETNDTHNPGDWEQVRGGDTDNNKRAHGTNKHRESTWREQGSTRTRHGNKHATTQGRQTQKLDTDRTQTLQYPPSKGRIPDGPKHKQIKST